MNKYEFQINEANRLYKKYQKELINFVNTPCGRSSFNLPKDIEYIAKISPNSYHVIDKFVGDTVHLTGKFYCNYMQFCPKEVFWSLVKMEISETQGDEALNHYLFGPTQRTRELFAEVYLTTTEFTAGGGDGHCDIGNSNYTTAHNASASDSADYTSGTNQSMIDNGTLSSVYYIKRSFFPVDTSSLTAGATISSAYLSVYATRENDANGYNAVIVTTTQASTTQVVTDDYDQLGTTDNGSQDFTNFPNPAAQIATNLNATGMSNINKTGITKLGMRLSGDISSSTPTGRNNTWPDSFSEDSTSSNRPFYSITYTLAGGMTTFYRSLVGVGI